MVEMNLVYEGDLRVRAVHGPSKKELVTDAPIDNHGKGESFSPTDLVCTALGSCMAIIMGMVAERHQMNLIGMKVTVKKHMVNEPARRIGKIELLFQVPGHLGEKDQKLLKNAAFTCPVHQSLNPEIIIDAQFQWS